jgi:AraC-like DNA-binding protein
MPTEEDANFIPTIENADFRECTPGWRIKKQILVPCNLTYITVGHAHYKINNIEYDFGPGDLICLPMGCEREGITYPDRLMHCFSIDFSLHTLTGGMTQLPFPIKSHIGLHKDLVRFISDLVFTWQEKRPGYQFKLHGLFVLIVHRIYELSLNTTGIDSNIGDFRISKVRRFIEKHYAEKMPIGKLAALAGLNEIYFDTLFREKLGVSPHKYHIKTRIRHAEDMLRSGEYKVQEVAKLCGYSDTIHFSKQFKSILGYPPSQCICKRED